MLQIFANTFNLLYCKYPQLLDPFSLILELPDSFHLAHLTKSQLWLDSTHLLHHLHTFDYTAAAAAKSLQSCLTLCDPIDGSPPGSPVPGILQARTLERVAISFSDASKGKVKVKLLSHVRLSATPWTAAYQAPLSMEFSRQEYWSGVPSPSLAVHATHLLGT